MNSDEQWKALRPKCKKAQPRDLHKEWGEIAAEWVNGHPYPDWRYLLADLRDRCHDAGINCPFSVTHLRKLAEEIVS